MSKHEALEQPSPVTRAHCGSLTTREGLDSIASEGRLGAVLVQFPVSFKNADDTRDYLFSLVRKFNQYPLVLEIRHESWNDPEILGRLAEEGVGFCNIGQPRLGKSLRGTAHVTAPVGYVRLHTQLQRVVSGRQPQ